MTEPSPKRIKLNHDHQESNALEWVSVESAFKNRICTGEISNRGGFKDPKYFLDVCFSVFENMVRKINKPLKINFSLICNSVLPKSGDVEDKYLNTKNLNLFSSDITEEWYSTKIRDVPLKKLGKFQLRDSGRALRNIVKLCINVNENKGFYAGRHTNLPKVIAKKRAVINVHSKGNACFKWAILAALYPVSKNGHRVSAYFAHANKLNFSNIPFPTELKHVHIFEKQNESVSVNVYGIKYSDYDWMVVEGGEVDEEREGARRTRERSKDFRVIQGEAVKRHDFDSGCRARRGVARVGEVTLGV
ncbi:uncharacterized protein LOC126109784 [Schistocerca cancellata]|uniref:uncharacterized protein LOC126109784 n=1 Tax=Schistocerca cancellata TaxID=274614 RepID=UPI002117F241|nr:uncharacterized protein LOC126109784 [Schistocerca cancellata]XP_049770801.1 uncharacterized protein LOC126109784 [Schistocerca cancellata]